jgi:hypothetical protein
MRLASFVICAAFLTFATSAFACVATPVRYHFKNETVRSALTVKAGERCMLTRRPTPRAHFHASVIIVQARNGTAQVIESHSVSYIPRPGFKGSDRFIQRICGNGGESLQSASCSSIEYVVTVD